MIGKGIGDCRHAENYRATVITDREDPLENPLTSLILLSLRVAYLKHLLENPGCVRESNTDPEALKTEYARLNKIWEEVSSP